MSDFRSSSNVRRFTVALAAVLALGAVGVGGYNMAAAQSVPDERPVFIAINPCRLVDTRVGPSNTGPLARPLGAETVVITAQGSNGECVGASAIPTSAVGLAMNVTAIRATEPGTFVTFWGSGPNPGVSNLNPAPGQPPTPNSVNTPLSDTGTFNMANAIGTVEVLIDVSGYYADHDHDERYPTIDQVDEQLAGYVPVGSLGQSGFLATGEVITTATPSSSVTRFVGPDGVTADVSRTAAGVYQLTISGLDAQLDGFVQLTSISDTDPRLCSLGSSTMSLATTYSVQIQCFGDDPTNGIETKDASFQFLITG